jgi:hypothetical protein
VGFENRRIEADSLKYDASEVAADRLYNIFSPALTPAMAW